jgi:hypothetical protein
MDSLSQRNPDIGISREIAETHPQVLPVNACIHMIEVRDDHVKRRGVHGERNPIVDPTPRSDEPDE